MASPADIASVRANTGQNTTEVYDDAAIGAIVDAYGGNTDAASAEVWRQLAAEYAKLVDTEEAGASHKWSTLFQNAMAMAKFYDDRSVGIVPVAPGRPTTIAITRV